MKWFKNEKNLDQDRASFAAAEAVMSEAEFTSFLEMLRTEKSYLTETRAKCLELLKFLTAPASRFGSRKMREKATALVAALQELKILTTTHFLVFPRNQTGNNLRHSLHPDYFILEMTNVSLDQHEFHLKAERQLAECLATTSDCYREYRAAARRQLQLQEE